jgi:hypothetical protein
MKRIDEHALVECLDFLAAGESVERVLARHPGSEAGLRPFLKAAVQVAHLPSQPTLAARRISRQAFLQNAAELRTAAVPSPLSRWRRALMPPTTLALILLIAEATLVIGAAAQVSGRTHEGILRAVSIIILRDDPRPVAAPTTTTARTAPQAAPAGDSTISTVSKNE